MTYLDEPTLNAPPAPRAIETEPAGPSKARPVMRPGDFALYLLVGAFFGIVLAKSEAISWFRIQEMFRFQSFHMYGIIGFAVAVAAVSVALIKRFGVKTLRSEAITIAPKEYSRGYSQIIGGTLFGAGWALLGACPGPLYALIGSGVTVMLVPLLGAIAGAWIYGALRPRLPH